MGRFKTWIYREYTWGEVLSYVPVWTILLGFATIVPISLMFLLSGVQLQPNTSPAAVQSQPIEFLWRSIIKAPLNEELIFRLLPLGLTRIWTQSLPVLLCVAAVSSVIFGYSHGGWSHIAMQGILGFGFALMFLKSGGMRGSILKPYAASVWAHMAWNAYVFIVLFWK